MRPDRDPPYNTFGFQPALKVNDRNAVDDHDTNVFYTSYIHGEWFTFVEMGKGSFQTVDVGNGILSTTVEIERTNEGRVIIIVDDFRSYDSLDPIPGDIINLNLGLIFPLQCGTLRNLDTNGLEAFSGRWTVDASPPIVGFQTLDDPPVTTHGDTPFFFDLRALILEFPGDPIIKGTLPGQTPDDPPLSGGAAFNVKARMLGSDVANGEAAFREGGKIIYAAQISTPAGRIVKDWFYGQGGEWNVSPDLEGAVDFLVDWDGLDENGLRVEASDTYYIRMKALLSGDPDTVEDRIKNGRIATTRSFSSAPQVRRVSITPDPYIVEEARPPVYFDEDGDGILDWPGFDTDGDGINDEFVFPFFFDHDWDPSTPDEIVDFEEDGIPDFPPTNPPPPDPKLYFFANLSHSGYDLKEAAISLEVSLEDGTGLFTATTASGLEITSNGLMTYAWDPTLESPNPLEDIPAQKILAQVTYGRCLDPWHLQGVNAQVIDPCLIAMADGDGKVGEDPPYMRISANVYREVPNQPFQFTIVKEKVGIGFPITEFVMNMDGSEEQTERRELLENVQLLKESADGGYDVDIEVHVAVEAGTEPPDPLILQARNMMTGATMDIPIMKKDGKTSIGEIYKATPWKLPEEFVDADFADSNLQAATRYSVGEFYRSNAKIVDGVIVPAKPGENPGVTEAFTHLIENSGAFGSSYTFLGRLAETAIVAEERRDLYPKGAAGPVTPPKLPATLPDDVEGLMLAQTVSSDPTNLGAPGFVSIEFTVKPTDTETKNGNPKKLTSVYVKVPRTPGDVPSPGRLPKPSPKGPNVLLWSFHGDFEVTGVARPSSDYDRSVSEGLKEWIVDPRKPALQERLETVHTLVLTGCSMLNINDYNNGFMVPAAVVGNAYVGWPGIAARTLGGEHWDKAMSITAKTDAVILGYSDSAPLLDGKKTGTPVNYLAQIIELYEKELVRLSSMVEPSELRQLAWMSANVKYADRAQSTFDTRWLAIHATAIDAKNFYYVPHEKIRGRPVYPEIPQPGTPKDFLTYESSYSTVRKQNPVWRVERLDAPNDDWGLPPGRHDFRDWKYNRRAYAKKVTIPGLDFPRGGEF